MSEQLQKHVSDAKKRNEIQLKKQALEDHRVEHDFDHLQEAKEQLDKIKNIDVGGMSEKEISRIVSGGKAYFESAKSRMTFIFNVPESNAVVPFFAKNLIFIGSVSGEGKSTCCANLAASALMQGKRVLVITNEEVSADVYFRVAALLKGWHYASHDKMTDAERAEYLDMVAKLAVRMTVIDDHYEDLESPTTTIEGFKQILDKLVEAESKYDVILIDYYENINSSKTRPKAEGWQVLGEVAKLLDGFKNRYPAPIVLFGQLKPSKDKDAVHMKERIQGRKMIFDKATCALEIRADKKDLKTEWVVHKARFNNLVASSFFTGWVKGRYVPYDEKHKAYVNEMKLKQIQNKGEGNAGS